MATLIGEYSSALFNSLPNVERAHEVFCIQNGPSKLESSLRELFIRFNVKPYLGICLVHKHFGLAEREVIVDVNGTSLAWKLSNSEVNPESGEFEKHQGHIKPRAWTISKGKLVPYEFQFQLKNSLVPGFDVYDLSMVDPEFLRGFIDLLYEHNLVGTLGLCLLRNPFGRQLEFSEGGANITIDINKKPDFESQTGYIDTAWTYHGPSPKLHAVLSCVTEGNAHRQED